MEACKNHEGKNFCVVCGAIKSIETHDGIGACVEHFDEVFIRCSKCRQYVDAETVEQWTQDSYDISRATKKVLCKTCANSERTISPRTNWLQTDWEMMESSHAVGIEMECINKSEMSIDEIYENHPKEMAFWSQHADGSVHGGLELVSSPITIKKFKKFMKDCAFMEKIFKVDSSCGLHVHLNMRPWIDFNTSDLEEIGTILQKLFYGFSKIEKYMYSTQPESRRVHGNGYTYCKTLADTFPNLPIRTVREMSPAAFIKAYYQDRFAPVIYNVRDIPKCKLHIRYCWLNLSVISMHDTIEVRLHSGSTSPRKIQLWVSILDKIMTHILDSTLEQLDSFGPEKLTTILNEDEMGYLTGRIEKFRMV
jgi:hypothetical protein